MNDLNAVVADLLGHLHSTAPNRSKFATQPAADRAYIRGRVDANDSFIFGHQIRRPPAKFPRRVPMWTQSQVKRENFLRDTYPVLNLGTTSREVQQAIERLPKRQRGIAERQLQRAAITEIVLHSFYIHMMRQGTIARILRRRFPLGRKNKLEVVRNALKKIRDYQPADD